MKYLHLVILVVLVTTSLAASSLQSSPPPPWAGRGSKHITQNIPQLRTSSSETMSAATLKKLLPKMSGRTAQILAAKLGIDSLEGKKLSLSQATLNGIVSTDNNTMENEPSLAVNPRDESIVVAFHHYYPTSDSCMAKVSFDGGSTFQHWNEVFLPLENSGDFCSDPVVRFSPNGAYVYYFYMNIDSGGNTSDVVMVRGNGFSPLSLYDSSPVVVFGGYGSVLIDKPWGDVAHYDVTGASDGYVYVTATDFDAGGGCSILFNRSANNGSTWLYGTSGAVLASSTNCSARVYTGSRPIGNPVSGWVTACWYDSSTDGWDYGKFQIDCLSNNNYGDFGGGTTYSFTAWKGRYELPYYLGPNGNYERWWGGMYPSLAVDDTGLIYIAFARDPDSNPNNQESGDVLLSYGWPTGTYWATQVVDDGSSTNLKSQGYPTVTARCDYLQNKCFSYVAYYQAYKKNKLYKTVYRKFKRPFSVSIPGTFTKYGQKKVSDVPSFSSYLFIGDYFDSFVTSRRYEVAWTDRSDVMSTNDLDTDVMQAVILP